MEVSSTDSTTAGQTAPALAVRFERPAGPVLYRPLCAADIPRLRYLHGVCFPVAYDDRFYNWLLEPQCLSLVAILPGGRVASGRSEAPREGLDTKDTDGAPAVGAGGDNALAPLAGEDAAAISVGETPMPGAAAASVQHEVRDAPEQPNAAPKQQEDEAFVEPLLVGFCIGKTKYVQGMLTATPVGYISTIGVDPVHRTRGLGHELLERFANYIFHGRASTTTAGGGGGGEAPAGKPQGGKGESWIAGWLARVVPPAWRAPRIKQLWLHCLASDDSIVHFYKKRQFVTVDRLVDFYSFAGRLHDAYVMVREVDALQKLPPTADKQQGKKAAARGAGGCPAAGAAPPPAPRPVTRSMIRASRAVEYEDDDNPAAAVAGDGGADTPGHRGWRRVLWGLLCCGMLLVVTWVIAVEMGSRARDHAATSMRRR